MKQYLSEGLSHYRFELFEPWPELTHGAFARAGGVSGPPHDSLNVSFAVGDDPERVRVNLDLMARSVGWESTRLVTVRQVHGRTALAVGRYSLGVPVPPEADSLVTDEPGVLLLLKFADCVPIILWDAVRKVVGLAHAGWKGTVLGVQAATLELMVERYGSDPSDVRAGIGPSIGPCCYDVGAEVAMAAARAFPGSDVLWTDAEGRTRFDLWRANAEGLMRAGVLEESIVVAGVCTRCRQDLFFSHRGSGGATGRFGVVAGIRDE